MLSLTSFTEELVNVSDVAFVLESSTIEVEPELAPITADPLVQLAMNGLPSLSTACAYRLGDFLGQLAP